MMGHHSKVTRVSYYDVVGVTESSCSHYEVMGSLRGHGGHYGAVVTIISSLWHVELEPIFH